MKTVRKWTRLTLMVLPILSACSSMQTQTAVDPNANLAQYKTYAWAPPTPQAERQRANNPRAASVEQAIRSSIEKELASKNILLAQGTDPDMLISYFGVASDEVTYGAVPHPGPWGPYGDLGQYNKAYLTHKGSLTVQFIDARTKRAVWQGTAEDTISDTGASQEQVAKAVDKMLQDYPTV